MDVLEQRITLAGKQARTYHFNRDQQGNNNLINAAENSDQPSNPPSPAATKQSLHFYGGNGFPVGVYQPLLTKLSEQFEVSSLAMRGYWYDLPTDKVLTREQDAELLIDYLEKTQDRPVIGVGHSQGATATAMAAAKRPDLFSALYLIDPVTFTKPQALLYSRLPRRFMLTQEPFKSTKQKPSHWASIDAYYQHLRQRPAYRRISDDNLYIFAKNSLVETDTGYQLLFQPQYELASYFGTPYVTPALKKLSKKTLPYYLILAKPSVFNSEKVRQSWQRVVPSERIITLSEYGHLLPMEAPERCAEIIDILNRLHTT
ncbi:alpha/beta fold hydrolase [Psychrobacter sp. FDAARGOS_221]|uniref:alpha/beta fold hydrolase n=1 Tax=Psychrobacter sp. FDAARGOS_221 TaxID=1975705 RepID=UPI000BB585C6|nr:alpha/beta hydrolase [Psychrobacter sp. FDAARGOS_221]PNK60636.1 alpha/beta hydrolase [Psychrobacter sp. FDAARGOS_221]